MNGGALNLAQLFTRPQFKSRHTGHHFVEFISARLLLRQVAESTASVDTMPPGRALVDHFQTIY